MKIVEIRGHKTEVYCTAVSVDGKLIASGSEGRTVRIWIAETGRLLHILTGHSEAVTSVDFSKDGKWLASACQSSVILWSLKKGQAPRHIRRIKSGSGKSSYADLCPRSVRFSPDSQKVTTLSRGSYENIYTRTWASQVSVWNVDSGDCLVSLGRCREASWTSDSKLVACTDGEHGPLRVFHADTGRRVENSWIGRRNASSFCTCMVFSTDEKSIFTASGTTIQKWQMHREGNHIATDEESMVTFAGHAPSTITSMSASPDDRYLVSAASSDTTLQLWDAATGNLIRLLEGHSGFVTMVTWSPDAQFVVSASLDGSLRIWTADAKV
jgi:WD40 repeat protein